MGDNSDSRSNGSVRVEAELTREQFDTLKELAGRRGVDANTVLRQAIATEKLLADAVKPSDEVLIKRSNNTYSKVLFSRES